MPPLPRQRARLALLFISQTLHLTAIPTQKQQLLDSLQAQLSLRLAHRPRGRSEYGPMTQLDQILLDDSEPGKLTPQQYLERWKPVLESLDRMFEDPKEPPTGGSTPKL